MRRRPHCANRDSITDDKSDVVDSTEDIFFANAPIGHVISFMHDTIPTPYRLVPSPTVRSL